MIRDELGGGNIVEVMTAYSYGITLYKQSEKTHDGEVDGKRVQIKGTQGRNSILIREEPEYLLVEYLDRETATIHEIYNGPGALPWSYRKYVSGINSYAIRINKLLELDAMVLECERIPSVVPVKKYMKPVTESNGLVENLKEMVQNTRQKTENHVKKKTGKTLVQGYINRNDQENLGCLNKPGTHWNQMAYLLRCNRCGFQYEANGCDVAIRKCPHCM